jgi:hypothetical protein
MQLRHLLRHRSEQPTREFVDFDQPSPEQWVSLARGIHVDHSTREVKLPAQAFAAIDALFSADPDTRRRRAKAFGIG